MKKILRLLVTDKCGRNCDGCCNKQWDLKKLPCINHNEFDDYDEILITGGEPLLFPKKLQIFIHAIRTIKISKKIILYTAKLENITLESEFNPGFLCSMLDGLTVTLHEQKDVEHF